MVAPPVMMPGPPAPGRLDHLNLATSIRSLRLPEWASPAGNLAGRMSVRRTTLSKIENENARLLLSVLETLARALEVTVARLAQRRGTYSYSSGEVNGIDEDPFVLPNCCVSSRS